MRFRIKRAVQLVALGICALSLHVLYRKSSIDFEGGEVDQSLGQDGDRDIRVRNIRHEPVEPKYPVRRNVRNIATFERSIRAIDSKIIDEVTDQKSDQNLQIQSEKLATYQKHSRTHKTTLETIADLQDSIFRKTDLKDIFISVKTTGKFHATRLKLLFETWVMFVKDHTYFFTDTDDPEIALEMKPGHFINTNCSSAHNRNALCCKMSVEFDAFIESERRWFCHVDDDTYINIPKLLELLQQYNHTDDLYLGKPSMGHPLEIEDKDHPGQKLAFWFATGGAGFCISRSLALKMLPFTGGGRLKTACDKIRLPDDCTIGYIIGHLIGVELTRIKAFHSHLEGLQLLHPLDLKNQITFSYSRYGDKMNVVNVKGFSQEADPTRLKSIHCNLFPYLRVCQGSQR